MRHSARVGNLPLGTSEEFLDLRPRFDTEFVHAFQNLHGQIKA